MNQAFLKKMRTVYCMLGFIFLAACAAPQKATPPEETAAGVETILVMPFQNLYVVYGDKAHIDCGVFNRRHVIGKVPDGTAEFMTQSLINLLVNDKPYRFVFPHQTDARPTHLQADQNCVEGIAELIAASGTSTAVDAILMGYLFHFKERVGKSYSVSSPASVSFGLFLARVTDGRIVWRGIYEETQQPLSENILKIGAFIKRKARWVTARELAVEGLEKLISTFPEP
ncbi:MAG: hypothetical protein JRE21_05900 [Deltaproteobacteria bacterium]|jgi:hypothetical protein|nr:hypothetical protein [Deltaproteobacteria bacterium]